MSGCPVDHGAAASAKPSAARSECPVEHNQGLDMKNMMPEDLHRQLPSPGQRHALSKERMKSTIPKGDESQGKEVWEYPSPQMFYNAMKRKWAIFFFPPHPSHLLT